MASAFDEPFLTGVSAAFINEFKQQYLAGLPPMSAVHCCDQLIKPRTQEGRCSFIELVGPALNSRGVEYAATANVHVCHAWSEDITTTLDMLLAHSEQQRSPTYYYIDLFCDNFHSPPVEDDTPGRRKGPGRKNSHQPAKTAPSSRISDWLNSTVRGHIKDIGHLLVVIPDVNEPLPLRRTWCLWELVCAIRKSTRISFLSRPEDDEFILDNLVNSTTGFDQTFRNFSFKRAKMQSSNVPYADLLISCLEQYDWENVQSMILNVVKDWIIGICKRNVALFLEIKEKHQIGYKLASNLGSYLHDFGDLDSGLAFLKKAIRIGGKLYPDDPMNYPMRTENLLRIGIIHKDLGDYQTARDHFELVKEAYDFMGIPEFDIWLRRNELQFYEAEMQAKERESSNALSIARDVLKERLDAVGKFNLGNIKVYTLIAELLEGEASMISKKKKDDLLEEALDVFHSALAVSKFFNVRDLKTAKLNEVLGHRHFARKEYEQSTARYESALEIVTGLDEVWFNNSERAKQQAVNRLQLAFNDSAFKLRVQNAKRAHVAAIREKKKSAKREAKKTSSATGTDSGVEIIEDENTSPKSQN